MNTSWAFAGNAVYAGCQWGVLVLLVGALSPVEVGSYALALAVTSPIFVLANFRLRNLLATGVASTDDFRDYLTARLLTTGCALLSSIAVGAVSSSNRETLLVMALVAAARSCDALSDICHGLFQRELDMRTAAVGLTLNGVVSLLLVHAALVLSRSLPLAAVGYAAGSGAALLAWDLPRAFGRLTARCRDASGRWSRVGSLIRRALPLGLSSAVGSVQSNLPRYAIASLLGPAPLAVFAAISHLPLLGHLAVNAASQAALPVLARDAASTAHSYQARLQRLVAASVGLGAVAVAVTIAVGQRVLDAMYGAEYAVHASVLSWLVATAAITSISVFLGTGRIARGHLRAQLAVTTTAVVMVAASMGPLVRNFGLNGAAYSLLFGAVVELGVYGVLTIRDFRRDSAASTLVPNVLAGGVQL